MLTSCDIFSPAATIACTQSAERKQSGYCVPLGCPAPILRAPTPPTMTMRGIDMHCCCICASTILWSPQVVPRPSLIYTWSYMWWQKMISCLISVFVKESSQLWSCWFKRIIHNCLCTVCWAQSYVCCWCQLFVSWLLRSVGQHLTVSSLMSLFMYPCTLYQQPCVDQWCMWFLVLSFFYMLLTAA